MPKGQKCPHCKLLTYHDEGSHRRCSSCGYIGWSWTQSVDGIGSGGGKKCPWCDQSTLHAILTLPSAHVLRRCSTCNYTAIEPPASD